MKKITYLVVFMVLNFVLFGCNKDDSPEDDSNNFIKVQNDEYQLANGIAEDYGVFEAGIYNIDLTFLSSEFTVSGSDYTGNGYGIYFEIFSSTPNKLAPGTYNYNDTLEALSFDDGEFFDTSGSVELEVEIESGTITVESSDNDYYQLTFNLVDDQGRTIIGSYTGNVTYASKVTQ